MQTTCVKMKLKKEFIEDVRIWFQTLNQRLDETMLSLENEGVIVESVFLDKYNDEFFLIYYMKAENISEAIEVFKKSTLTIDAYHKSCKEKYCEERVALEPLLDLNRIKEYRESKSMR